MRMSLTGGDDMNRMRRYTYYDLTITHGYDVSIYDTICQIV